MGLGACYPCFGGVKNDFFRRIRVVPLKSVVTAALYHVMTGKFLRQYLIFLGVIVYNFLFGLASRDITVAGIRPSS